MSPGAAAPPGGSRLLHELEALRQAVGRHEGAATTGRGGQDRWAGWRAGGGTGPCTVAEGGGGKVRAKTVSGAITLEATGREDLARQGQVYGLRGAELLRRVGELLDGKALAGFHRPCARGSSGGGGAAPAEVGGRRPGGR